MSNADKKAWVVEADGEVDQICSTKREAEKEVKDLKATGCDAHKRGFDTWQAAEDYADKVRGY